MISEVLFIAMIAFFWIAEFSFGMLVLYWFITQGFASNGSTHHSDEVKLEDRRTTMRSLAIWIGFFSFIILGIIIGS